MKFISSSTHLQLLLDAGANPNGATDHGKDDQVETPLQMAAASGNGYVSSFVSVNRLLISSVGRAPDHRAVGRVFESHVWRPNQVRVIRTSYKMLAPPCIFSVQWFTGNLVPRASQRAVR